MQKYTKILPSIIILYILSCTSSAYSQYEFEWAFPYGGNGWEIAHGIAQCKDGGNIIVGSTKRYEQHLWIIKVDELGNALWGKSFKDYPTSVGNAVIETSDKSIVVAGYFYKRDDFQSDIWLGKFDSIGNLKWAKTFGGDADDQAYSLIQTKDNCYVLAGYSSSNRDYEPNWWIMKTDTAGNMLWDKNFGNEKDDKCLAIAESVDGGLLATGYTSTVGDVKKQFTVVKLTDFGGSEWVNSYTFNGWEMGTSITGTRDSNIVAVGFTRVRSLTDYDALIMKLNSAGDTLWTRAWGWGNWEELAGVVETYDNAYATVGFSKTEDEMRSNFLLLKYDRKGKLLYDTIFTRKSLDYANCLVETKDNGIVMAGSTYMQGKSWDFAVLKFSNQPSWVRFSAPYDSISTSTKAEIVLSACIFSLNFVKNVKVLVNGNLQIDLDGSLGGDIATTEDCAYSISKNLVLNTGFNRVKVLITDDKDYTFFSERIIYYFPPPNFTW